MSKAKLYFLGATIVLVAGAFIYNNSIRRNVDGVAKDQAEIEDLNNILPQVEEGTTLPSDFPQDFPIYPESKIESSYQSIGEEVKAISVVWLTPGTLDGVSSFYKRELENTGRKVSVTSGNENSVTMTFKKGQEEGFIGIGTDEDDMVIISVTIGASFQEPSI